MDQDRQAILFVTLNPHQRRYFYSLGESLKDCYQVHYVHYGLKDWLGVFRRPALPAALAFQPGELDSMLEFPLLKTKVRGFSGFRGWMYSRTILERQAYSATAYFHDYIIRHDIDLVCVWNGTLIALASAVRVARKLGRKTLFFENGYLPNTTTADPKGVNNHNSLVGKSRAFYDAVEPEKDRLDLLFAGTPSIRELKPKWYQRVLKKGPVVQPENVSLPAKFVFLPFQVHDDTQVLLHSPHIKTMEALVDCVVNAVRKHNISHSDNLWIVAKEHPSDFGRIDYSPLKEKYQDDNIVFLRYYPTPELIKKTVGVITLNSSVGIESLVQHKPVITLGNAFYNVEGVVRHIPELTQFEDALSVLDELPDHDLIDKFLYYLRFCYLVEGSWRHPGQDHYECVARKILTVL